jgi:hypothetical protein
VLRALTCFLHFVYVLLGLLVNLSCLSLFSRTHNPWRDEYVAPNRKIENLSLSRTIFIIRSLCHYWSPLVLGLFYKECLSGIDGGKFDNFLMVGATSSKGWSISILILTFLYVILPCSFEKLELYTCTQWCVRVTIYIYITRPNQNWFKPISFDSIF